MKIYHYKLDRYMIYKYPKTQWQLFKVNSNNKTYCKNLVEQYWS